MDSGDNLIIRILSCSNRSLMIKEIAEKTGLDRHTVARKLDTLEILGLVRKIQIGNAKRYFHVETLPMFSLVDISSDLIIVIDGRWRIQYINRSAQILLNLTDHPIIGERIDLLHLDLFSSQPIIEGLKQFSPQKVSKMEISCNKKGIERWYEISIMNIALKPGVLSIVIIAVDITEKNKMKQRLEESEARYRSLFEDAPIPIIEEDHSEVKRYLDLLKCKGITDLRSFFTQNPESVIECIKRIRIIQMNKESRNTYYCPQNKEISLSPLLPFLTEYTINALKELLISFDMGEKKSQFEISIVTRQGEILWFLLHYAVINHFKNDLSHVFVSFQDITEKKRLDDELRKKQRDLISITEEVIAQDNEIRQNIGIRESMYQNEK